MSTFRYLVSVFSFGLLGVGAGTVSGQAYPNKPIRMVTAAIGGGSDFTTRLIAQAITGPLGQPVIVDNRPPGVIQGVILSNAPADGYTLLVSGSSVFTFPLLQKAPYDPVRDFSPITVTEKSPTIMAVSPSLAVASVKELIGLAKAKPGALNYASTGTGSINQLAAELFKSMAGVNIVHVAYKATGPALTDVIGGQVQIMFASAASVMSLAKAGKLNALAVTSAQPSALTPGIPTVAATGLPGYEMEGITAIFAPAKTPEAIIDRLNQEIVRFLKTAKAKEQLLNVGSEVVAGSPAELAATLKSEMAKMGKVIKEAGLRIE